MGGILSLVLGKGPGGRGEDEPEGSHVKVFHSSDSWQNHFNEIKDSSKLMVIDFSASWCGPCRAVAPVFRALADKFSDVEFAKIDVDELKDVAKEFGVQAMPTFVLLKNGQEQDRVVGGKKDELEKMIKMYKAT